MAEKYASIFVYNGDSLHFLLHELFTIRDTINYEYWIMLNLKFHYVNNTFHAYGIFTVLIFVFNAPTQFQ